MDVDYSRTIGLLERAGLAEPPDGLVASIDGVAKHLAAVTAVLRTPRDDRSVGGPGVLDDVAD